MKGQGIPGGERARGLPARKLLPLLVVAMAIWGGTWPTGKVMSTLAPLELTISIRFLLTTVSLLVVCLWRREPVRLSRAALPWALSGAALMSLYNYLFFGGLRWGLATKGGMIVTCLNPIFTLVISAIAFRRRVGLREALGLGLGIAAGAVLLGVWKLAPAELLRSGNLFFLGAALSWAALTVVSQAGQKHAGYLSFSLWIYGLSAVLNLVVLALRGFPLTVSSPATFWAIAIYLGVVGTAFATTVYFLAARALGAHRAAFFNLLVPGFALLLSWLLLGEAPDWVTLAGGALGIAAVCLVNSAGPEEKRGEEDPGAALDRGAAGRLLSALGRRLRMPRGIVVQAAEAKRQARRFDGSAGIALERRVPLHLSAVQRHLAGLDPAEVYAYSPTQGNMKLREKWGELLLEKNPSLAASTTSLPTVVPGLTFGVSACADLFVDPGDTVLIPEPSWDNYDLIFRVRHRARIRSCPMLDGEGLDVAGIAHAIAGMPRRRGGKGVVLLNFPHNPSGYSPTETEAEALAAALGERAERGGPLLVVLDDAYFGLGYEPGLARESLFARLASLHENLLAVKVDGTTKEDLAWGFRIAFVTFGGKGLDAACCRALEEKLAAEIRSLVSSASTPAQTLLLKAMEGGEYRRDKAAAHALLEARYRRVREVLGHLAAAQPDLARPLPYNSGYFVCLSISGGGAEAARRLLLEREAIGSISFGDRLLRIAYSAVDIDDIEPMLEAVYRAVAEVRRGRG